jgi:hypothetical protein
MYHPQPPQGHFSPEKNQPTQHNKAGKPQIDRSTTSKRPHTSHNQQITSNPKTMARRAPRDWTEKPLPEPRVGTRGVFDQGGFCYIYLKKGEQPIRCLDIHPNIGSIICRIRAKGYLVGLTYNSGRLLPEDNGDFKVLLGNRRTVYMLTIYKDTPAK